MTKTNGEQPQKKHTVRGTTRNNKNDVTLITITTMNDDETMDIPIATAYCCYTGEQHFGEVYKCLRKCSNSLIGNLFCSNSTMLGLMAYALRGWELEQISMPAVLKQYGYRWELTISKLSWARTIELTDTSSINKKMTGMLTSCSIFDRRSKRLARYESKICLSCDHCPREKRRKADQSGVLHLSFRRRKTVPNYKPSK